MGVSTPRPIGRDAYKAKGKRKHAITNIVNEIKKFGQASWKAIDCGDGMEKVNLMKQQEDKLKQQEQGQKNKLLIQLMPQLARYINFEWNSKTIVREIKEEIIRWVSVWWIHFVCIVFQKSMKILCYYLLICYFFKTIQLHNK